MKKFLLKCCFLSCTVIFLLVISNFLFVNSVAYNNILVDREVTKFFDVQDDLQIVNFGTSHGRSSLNYENYAEYNTFNFAMSSQYLIYDKILLEAYLDNIADNAIAIIPISYFSLYRNEIDSRDFESRNKRYYDFLESEHIINCDISYYYLNKYFPLLALDAGNVIESFKTFEKKEYTGMYYDILDINSAEQIGYNRFLYHTNLFDNPHQPTALPENTTQIKEIIKLCESKNITPVFITTPLYHTYTDNFSKEFFDTFYSDITSITNGYLYLDYSKDERFHTNNLYFNDTDHLNCDGAIYFTDILLSDIDTLIGLP
ncbi:MAG: hypothetical protein R3Y12_07305 [Clostridia bacterium]